MRNIINIAKALSDENRLRVLMMLRKGELCLCQLIEMLALAPSTVSKHMAVLHQAHLVESRKQGRWIYYRLADADAPESVRKAIRWVHNSTAKDNRILGDAAQLECVCKMDKDELCACYKKTKRSRNKSATAKAR